MQAKKIFENWYFWLVADAIYAVYFLPVNHLYISAVVYAVFLVMAAKGLLEWRLLMSSEIVKVWEAEAYRAEE